MVEEQSELVANNKNLIYSISHLFKNYVDKEDLFQAGFVGLIKASQNYRPNSDTKFSTYAYTYILGEMAQYVRKDKGIKVSREITKLNLKIEKASILLTQKLMREPTLEEISDFLEIPISLVIESRNSIGILQSIDDNYGDDSINLHEIISDNSGIDIDTLMILKESISKLTPEERKLIKMRYFEDLTQTEAAERLGMSQVQVSRRETKVLTKMRSGL